MMNMIHWRLFLLVYPLPLLLICSNGVIIIMGQKLLWNSQRLRQNPKSLQRLERNQYQEDSLTFPSASSLSSSSSLSSLSSSDSFSGMTTKTAVCPCNDKQLCQPIPGPPVRQEGELFGFSNTQPHTIQQMENIFNWTYLSTIAWASDSLLCEAHRHGTRLVAETPWYNLSNFVHNATARSEWIESALTMVQGRFFDGLTFDYEEPIANERTDPLASTYVALVRETKQRFQQVHSGYQISVCVAWSPDGIDGRNYPVQELAQVSDLLYVMDYDTQSQIYNSACIANANAPYYGMIHGLTRYLELDIAPQKLVLGVPWYGYRYSCLPGTTRLMDRYCPIAYAPFRDALCSDAAGTEIPYLTILTRLWNNNNNTTATTATTQTSGLQRDEAVDAPYFNELQEDNTIYQYWFDDAESLRHKYQWVRKAGLAGVGPFQFDDLDAPSLDPNGTVPKKLIVDMWSAFDEFFSHQKKQTVTTAETTA